MLSLRVAKISERERPSNLFNSLDVLTNIRRTRRQYHIIGGRIQSMKGKAATAMTTVPKTNIAAVRKL